MRRWLTIIGIIGITVFIIGIYVYGYWRNPTQEQLVITLILVVWGLSAIILIANWNDIIEDEVRKGRPHWIHHAVRSYLDALLAVFVIGALVEIPHVQSVMEKALRQATDIPGQFSNPALTARRFPVATLKSIRSEITDALRRRHAIPEERALLDGGIYPVFDGPVRRGLRVTRDVAVVRHQNPDTSYLLVRQSVGFTQFNPRGIRMPLPIASWMTPLHPFVADSDLFRLDSVKVDGKLIGPVGVERGRDVQGGRVTFRVDMDFPDADSVTFEYWATLRVPRDEPFSFHVSVPTFGLVVHLTSAEINREEKGEPKMLVFGMEKSGPEVEPEEPRMANSRRWVYPGWLFVGQGWEVGWKVP